MQHQSGSDAVRLYSEFVASRIRPRGSTGMAECRVLIEAAVDELKATGMTPERVLLEIKHLSAASDESSYDGAGWTEVVTWCLQRYFATEPNADPEREK